MATQGRAHVRFCALVTASKAPGAVVRPAARLEAPCEEAGLGRLNITPMADQPNATAVPPIEIVVSEVIANLAFFAHALLEPTGDGENAAPRFEDAEIAIDIAGRAYDRISTRLPEGQRAAIARLLTELRLTYVKKRDL